MATFTLHRIRVVIPDGSSYTCTGYDWDLGEYYPSERICDFISEAIVFGFDEAWKLYRETINNIRNKYFRSDNDRAIVTIESTLVPKGVIIMASSSFPYIGESELKNLRWEEIDKTIIKI